MDCFNSHNIESSNQKVKRVRSWYLYEQYNSLKRNQQHAAQQLKERSRQKKILRQELNERRERRRLCDQRSTCHSESYIKRSIRHDKTPMSVSADDFDSFQDDDDFDMRPADPDMFRDFRDDLSNHSHSKHHEEKDSRADSLVSVVENIKSYENMADEMKNELEEVRKNIKDNIHLQLNTVKQNVEAIEKLSKVSDYETDSSDEVPQVRRLQEEEHGLYTVWSKLVSFAYQITQLNHGNCYHDYSSQISTAVLVCDVLRYGINKMCHYLQPYVSPIKFASDDEEDSASSAEDTKNTEKLQNESNYRRKYKYHFTSNKYNKNNLRHKYYEKDYHSENVLKKSSRGSFEQTIRNERASEPWRGARSKKYSIGSAGPRSRPLAQACACCECCSFDNPLAEIVSYIDTLSMDCRDCDNKLCSNNKCF